MEILKNRNYPVPKNANDRVRVAVGGFAFFRLAWMMLLFGTPMMLFEVSAQVTKENQIKAVFLWRIAQFVEWPTNAFESPESPIVIGVLGDNPFGNVLETAVRDETAHGRKIVVRHFNRVQDALSAHIVFVSRSETSHIREIAKTLGTRSILSVSDIENFARENGGIVQLIKEENKIKLRINLDAANSAGIVLDARLLRMAEVVRSK